MKKYSNEKRLKDIRLFRWMRRNYKKIRLKKEYRKKKLGIFVCDLSFDKRYSYSRSIKAPFYKISPPSNFSFIDNTDEIISYFNTYGKALSCGKKVNFNLKSIQLLGFDALSLLLAMINNETYVRNNTIKGLLPVEKNANLLFRQSGFLEHVFSSVEHSTNNGGMIGNFSDKKVDTDCLKNVLGKIFHNKESLISQNMYSSLVECMANTNNHAKCKWRLTYHIGEDCVRICFIDLGIGIIKHLKPTTNIISEKLLNLFGENAIYILQNSCATIQALFERNPRILNRVTSTMQPGRGTGLPRIHDVCFDKQIKTAIMITNDVHSNIKEDSYKKLKGKFNGTFYYREIYKNEKN